MKTPIGEGAPTLLQNIKTLQGTMKTNPYSDTGPAYGNLKK